MLCLRCSTGGLHFYTYFGCLATSVLYLWLSLYVMPLFYAPTYVYLCIMALCIFVCYIVGPITSKYRPPSTPQKDRRYKNFICAFLSIYAIILYFVPENNYIHIGFGIIILHTLQLLIAKIQKKGAIKTWYLCFCTHLSPFSGGLILSSKAFYFLENIHIPSKKMPNNPIWQKADSL